MKRVTKKRKLFLCVVVPILFYLSYQLYKEASIIQYDLGSPLSEYKIRKIYKGMEFPEIEELNENINLPIKFGTPESECEEWSFQEEYPKKCGYREGDNIRYIFNGFPDLIYQSDVKFCEASTSDSKYKFYGFSVGDDMEKVEMILKKNIYMETTIAGNGEWFDYEKGFVKFSITTDEDHKVDWIRVKLLSTNYTLINLRYGY